MIALKLRTITHHAMPVKLSRLELTPDPDIKNPPPQTVNPQPQTVNSQPQTVNPEVFLFFFFITLDLELSDIKVYEP